MQVILVRLMSKGEYLIVPKGTKFIGSGKLGLRDASMKCLETDLFNKFNISVKGLYRYGPTCI